MPHINRNLVLWAAVALLSFSVVYTFKPNSMKPATIMAAYSDFLLDVTAGKVSEVAIKGPHIYGRLSDGIVFQTYAPEDPSLVQRLTDKGVKVVALPDYTEGEAITSLLISWLPMLLIAGVWIYFMRKSGRRPAGGAMGFGKSRAKLMTDKQVKKTFEDVAGIDEAKDELQEIVEFLKEPSKFQRLGGKIPRGVLLVGPPGTGKTLLARAIAGEANVPFFAISGSDFVEMFVGVGASRVRDMFEQAKKVAPCIVFIDEIDAMGRQRGAGIGGGNDEREQTLNQMLVEMDGFSANEGIILVAATNRPDVLDPALLRPGRFDRQVYVPNPDVAGRDKVLRVHMRKVPIATDVDTKVLARGTPGFSGADLANLVNEGALLAARLGKKIVSMQDFEAAKDKVMMGAERRSLVMSPEEKRMTAYHEAGHALVAISEPECDPVHKATIIPRGRALGLVMSLPDGDRYSKSRAKLTAEIAMAMGGRAAEELAFGPENVSNGASGDIRMATDQARMMVTEWGMSDAMGVMAYGSGSQEISLGHSVTQRKAVSEETARLIDVEVKGIVDAAYRSAKATLLSRINQLHQVAAALLEFETLTGSEIRGLVTGHAISREPENPLKTVRNLGSDQKPILIVSPQPI